MEMRPSEMPNMAIWNLVQGTHQPVGRDADVVEGHGAAVAADVAHDGQDAVEAISWGVSFHEEGADASFAFGHHLLIGDGEDHGVIGVGRVGDPLLAPGDDPVVAIAAGFGLDVPDVGPSVRLAQGKADHLLAPSDEGQELLAHGVADGGQHMRGAVHKGGDGGLAEEALGPGDEGPAWAVFSVHSLFHEEHGAHAEATTTDALGGEHPVIPRLGGLHAHLLAQLEHLVAGTAVIVEKAALVFQKGLVLVLQWDSYGIDELLDAGDGDLNYVADVFGDADVGSSHGKPPVGPVKRRPQYDDPQYTEARVGAPPDRSLRGGCGDGLLQVDGAGVEGLADDGSLDAKGSQPADVL
mgnify:CR=1 FL=1